jgi:hypothetical protein
MTKNIIRKFIESSIVFGSLLILFYTIIDLKTQVKQIDVLQFKLDSVIVRADILHDRKFSLEVENATYNGALECLRKNDPKAAEKFVKCMRNEIK